MQRNHDTPGAALWQAAAAGRKATVTHLLAEGVDVNVWNERGRTALWFAAAHGRHEIARQLVAAGAWVDAHEDYDIYESPLMIAAVRGDFRMVEFLLMQGADPTLHVGIPQRTAAGHARDWHPEIAALLDAAEDQVRRKQTAEQSCI